MEIEYGWNRLKAAIKNLAYQFKHNNNVQKEKDSKNQNKENLFVFLLVF